MKIIPVIKVSGSAFLINRKIPILKFLLSSNISLMECLNECRKQK